MEPNALEKSTNNSVAAVEDKQSQFAWQKINEISRKKSTSRAKLKTTWQEERLLKWKVHYKILQGNPPKIFNCQQDIKLEKFSKEELNVQRKRIKSKNALGLDEIPHEIWKTRKFVDMILPLHNAVYR